MTAFVTCRKSQKSTVLIMQSFRLTILVIILYGCSGNSEVKRESDWVDHNLFGNVRTMTSLTYSVNDSLGHVRKKEREGGIGQNLLDRYHLEFNQSGFITEVNKIINETNTKSLLYYDQNNWQYERKNFDERDNLKRTIKYEKDASGNHIKSSVYGAEGQLEKVYTNSYDKKGRKVETVVSYPDSMDRETTLLKYDEVGNLVEEQRVNPFSEDYISKWEYADKGRVITEYYYIGDRLISTKVIKEDKNGNVVEYRYNSSDHSIAFNNRYEYTYDEIGNWTSRIKYQDGIPIELIERTYVYY